MTDEQRKLAEDNMRLAYGMAWKFKNCGLELEEIESLALLGLTEAAAVFDPSRGYQFSTFAGKCIRNKILIKLRNINKIKTISLDQKIQSGNFDSSCTLLDLVPYNKAGYEQVENMDLIPSLLAASKLKPREEQVVELVLVQGMRQEDAWASLNPMSVGFICRQ